MVDADIDDRIDGYQFDPKWTPEVLDSREHLRMQSSGLLSLIKTQIVSRIGIRPIAPDSQAEGPHAVGS
jgi:hypothetical protein